MKVQLRDHQRSALNRLENGNILWGGVGSGKSRVALAYYMKNEAPKDIYVITTAKKRDSLDWETEAAPFVIGKSPDDSVAGTLHVDSWNNMYKYRDVEGAFFVFDEQRLVGSGKWSKDFIRIARNNRWILLSATPGDNWLDYIPVFVANGFFKNRSEFKREHVVYNSYTKFPKVERYLGVQKLTNLRNQILVNMPMQKHTTRNEFVVWTDYDMKLMKEVTKERWHIYEDRPTTNVAELFYVLRRIANSDPSRLEKIRELQEKHPKLVIFYNFNYELKILKGLGQDTTLREWNGRRHEDLPEGERWVYLVQYAAGAEGWNCTTTNSVIFYSLTYSYKQFEQAHGRIDRMNTHYSDLYYYILRSRAPIDYAVYKALKEKRDFQVKRADLRSI